MATARGVSYELAFKDFSKVNYASSRASLLQDYKRFDYEQAHLAEYVLNEVFEAWLDIEVMAGRVKIPPIRYFQDKVKFYNYKWVWPKRDWVDPLKDISAIEKEIALGITTTTDIAAARGDDFEQNIAQKAIENEILDKYGVTLGTIAEQVDVNDEGDVVSVDNIPV
jgi:capsid protein